MKTVLALVTVVILFFDAGRSAAEVIVFGDSLSDTGNFQIASGGAAPPAPLYPTGRFSNGPLWIDVLAAKLNEAAPNASLAGGSNFAFNGARAAGISPYGVPDVTTQVDWYLASSGNFADPDNLYVIWAGANDIFFGAAAGEPNFIADAVTAIQAAIVRLHAAGARKFVVLNLPPLGQTPYFNYQPAISTQLDYATFGFNQTLAAAILALGQQGNTHAVALVDIHTAFGQILSAPQRFQLINTTDSCTIFDPTGTGIGLQLKSFVDPDKYLYWDSVHPTNRGHEIIAKLAYQNVGMQLSGLANHR